MGQLFGANIPASPYFNAMQQGIGRALGMGAQTGTQYPLGAALYGPTPAFVNRQRLQSPLMMNQPTPPWMPPRTSAPGVQAQSAFPSVAYGAAPPTTSAVAQTPSSGTVASAAPTALSKSDLLAAQRADPYYDYAWMGNSG